MKGTIIKILPNKGYGFIRGEEDKQSRFFHAAQVNPCKDFDTMHEGQQVEFDHAEGTKGNGLRAVNVRVR